MIAARQAGIRLITLFEDEWEHNRPVVEKTLLHLTGRHEQRIGARKLTVEKIDAKSASAFYEGNHLQGAPSGGVHLGAFHDGLLVGAMTFGHPTRQNIRGVELKRFAASISSPGLASKLFTSYVREYDPERIVSFSDSRWFTGHMYEVLGFRHDGEIPPDYSYFKRNRRLHKSQFRKSVIKRKFPEIYQEELTEVEMMDMLGFSRIWDCGKIRWVWSNPE